MSHYPSSGHNTSEAKCHQSMTGLCLYSPAAQNRGADDLVHWASRNEYYRAFAAEEMCAVSRGLSGDEIIQLIHKGAQTLMTGKESSWGTEFDVFNVFSKADDAARPSEQPQKSTASLVLAAEQKQQPYLVSDAGHQMSRWINGTAGPADRRAKASDLSSDAGTSAGEWLKGLSNQQPPKRRVPLAAERGGNEYEEQQKRCFEGMTPPVDAKVSYKLNGTLCFGVVAKLYSDGAVLGCRRCKLNDNDSFTLLDDIDFVNAAEHELTVLETFPAVADLVSSAFASILGRNNAAVKAAR